MWSWIEAHPVKTTAMSGMVVQVGRPIVSLMTMPFLYQTLGESELGVWLIALSIQGILNFVSIGISSSVITHVGRTSALDYKNQVTQTTTAAFLIAAICAAFLMVVILSLTSLLDWSRLLNLESTNRTAEVNSLIFAVSAMVGFSFVSVIPRQVMFGQLRGYLAHMLDFIGLLLGVAGLLWATIAGLPLWGMAILYMGPSLLFVFLGGLVYFHFARITAFSPGLLERVTFQKLRNDALRMSGYHLAFAVSAQTDMLLIGLFLGSAATVPFGVAHRVFSVLMLIGYTLNQAQLPAMARADAEGDLDTLIPIFRKMLFVMPLMVIVIAVGITLAYEPLVTYWLGKAPETDSLILWGMVAWVSVASAANTCDHLLRARNETRLLMISMAMMATMNLALTLLFLPHIGAAGAIWGSVIAYSVTILIPYLWRLRKDIWSKTL